VKEHSFKKNERLVSRQLINALFQRDRQDDSIKINPFVVTWRRATLKVKEPAQVVMVASKKGLPRAHDRARIKRQMKELYRYRKQELYRLLEGYNQQITVAFIYIGKQEESYAYLQARFDKVFKAMLEKLPESFESDAHRSYKSL
jgi:ribonuclease P protein component